MSREFEDAIVSLSKSLGASAEQSITDEHKRWELYRRALVQDSAIAIWFSSRSASNRTSRSHPPLWYTL